MRLVFILMLLLSTSAFAVEPGEILKDPAMEMRARQISKELRCLICQGEAIDDSNADIAKDIRILVRRRVEAGDTDTQVKEYLRSRYGDFILLKPPFEKKTFALWLAPLLMLLAGVFVVARFLRKPKG